MYANVWEPMETKKINKKKNQSRESQVREHLNIHPNTDTCYYLCPAPVGCVGCSYLQAQNNPSPKHADGVEFWLLADQHQPWRGYSFLFIPFLSQG